MIEQYGWVWEPEPKHMCSPPNDLRNHFEKALWRCAQCDQYWEVYFSPDHGQKDMRLISPHDATARMAGSEPPTDVPVGPSALSTNNGV